MEDNFKDAPIQIVSIKEDGDFEITVDGINFLSALKNKKVLLSFISYQYYLLQGPIEVENLFLLI